MRENDEANKGPSNANLSHRISDCLTTGSPALAKDVWVAPTHFLQAGLNTFPWPTTGSGFVSFSFAVPEDFESFDSATVVLLPKGNVTGNYDVFANVKRNGEAAGDSAVFTLSIPAVLASRVIADVDVSSLFIGQFDASSGGNDYVSLFFWFPTTPGSDDATALGMRFSYNERPIDTGGIADGAITNAPIANDAVDSAKIATNSVDSSKVVDESLTSADLAVNSVGSDEIAASAVGAVELATNSVSSLNVVDGSLTAADLASNSVGGAEISENSVAGADIIDNSVTGADILDNSLTCADIDNVTGADINGNSVTSAHILDNSVTGADILDNSVTSADILGNTIQDIDILDEAGADWSSGNQGFQLTSTDVVARSVQITAPASGFGIVNASGSIHTQPPVRSIGRCSITTGTLLDDTHSFVAGGDGTLDIPFGATRGFSVAEGTTTFNLVCDEFSGDVALFDSSITAIFVSTRR